MQGISVMIKPVSGRCNMECAYCFYKDEVRQRIYTPDRFMNEETLRQVVRRTIFRAEKQVQYIFQGGEPTLRGLDFFRRFVAYTEEYNHHKIAVHKTIQTNGMLLDEEWCRFLKENRFLTGLSVDGMPQTHNIYRKKDDGGNTFEAVERAAGLLDKYQAEYNILTVVTPPVAENIQEIYRFYKQKGWNYQQYIPCLEPLGEKHGSREYSLGPEQYGDFLTVLFRLWKKDLKKRTHPYIRQFDQWIRMAAGFLATACDQKGCCGVQYAVEADGSVYPCDFYMLDNYYLGNFNRDRLPGIDARRKEAGFLERSLLLDHACHSCRHYMLCRGGCQRMRDFCTSTGRYTNYFCRGFQKFFDTCGEEIKEIADNVRRFRE